MISRYIIIHKLYLFFSSIESKVPGTPFLLDKELYPITAVNHWLRKLVMNGATSSPNTWRTYAYAIFDFFSYLEANNYCWTDVDDLLLYEYREIQDNSKSPHTKERLNRKTINSRLLIIGGFYRFAYDSKYIEQNKLVYKTLRYRVPRNVDMYAHLNRTFERTIPAVAFERLPRSRVKWRTSEQVNKWINSISAWRDKIIAKLMFHAGMRRSEVTGLRLSQLPDISDVDTNFHEVKFRIVGKGNKKRDVVISIRLFLEICDYIRIDRKKFVRGSKNNHEYLFVTSRGNPIKPNTLNQIFNAVSVKTGISITPHMLRHSFAVFFLNHLKNIGHSQPLKSLQARLGHSNISTTLIYTHISDSDLAEESEANALFFDKLLGENSNEAT